MTKKNENPVQMIVVDADGEIITSANGHISSDNRELVKRVKQAWFPIQLIQPFGTSVRPSRNPADLIGLTASLFSARPGRTKLLEAPEEVWEWLKNDYAQKGGGCLHSARSGQPVAEQVSELSKEDAKLLSSDPEFYESVVAEGKKYNPEFEAQLTLAIEKAKGTKKD